MTPRPAPAFCKYAVTPTNLARQLAWLKRAGYVSITLDALLDYRAGRGGLPARPVIITFDDGFRDCIEYAMPLLAAQHMTAIFYLVAGLVGGTSAWLRAERGIELPLVTWTEARQVLDAGFECGAHTMTHPRLAQLSEAACRKELFESRQLLSERLGRDVRHLAYPFGSFDERVQACAAQAGYDSACTVREGFATGDDAALALPRIPITGFDSLIDFAWRLWTARTFREWRHRQIAALSRPYGRIKRHVA